MSNVCVTCRFTAMFNIMHDLLSRATPRIFVENFFICQKRNDFLYINRSDFLILANRPEKNSLDLCKLLFHK